MCVYNVCVCTYVCILIIVMVLIDSTVHLNSDGTDCSHN